MRSATALSLGLFVVVGIPHVVRAQSARIIGHTHASGDSTRSVPGAEVTMTPGNRTARADSAGTFVFPSVADGTYILRVRRLGFVAREARVLIIAQHDETVSVPLDVSAERLTEVTIAGRRVTIPMKYADAYARVARGRGDFFTREQIDSMRPPDMKSMLQRVPGVRTTDSGFTFGRCNSNVNPLSIEANSQPTEKVQVYIDGVLATKYSGRSRGGDASGADDVGRVLADIRPSMLELVEVYRGGARIPGEYLSDACAVILLWTR